MNVFEAKDCIKSRIISSPLSATHQYQRIGLSFMIDGISCWMPVKRRQAEAMPGSGAVHGWHYRPGDPAHGGNEPGYPMPSAVKRFAIDLEVFQKSLFVVQTGPGSLLSGPEQNQYLGLQIVLSFLKEILEPSDHPFVHGIHALGTIGRDHSARAFRRIGEGAAIVAGLQVFGYVLASPLSTPAFMSIA